MVSMIQKSLVSPRCLLLLIWLILVVGNTAALSIAYCSSENTGSGSSPVTNQYQSNGACFETCKSNYAFAVIQGNTCWCSNYVPANTVSTGLCNEQCPGFGSERCGSSSKGLFGYIALSRSPSGTAGGASSTASSSSPSSDEDRSPTTSMVTSSADPSPVTVVQTITASPVVETSIVSIAPSTSSAAPTTTQQSSTSSVTPLAVTTSTTSPTPSPTTSPTPSPTPSPPPPPPPPSTSSTPPAPAIVDTPSWSPTPVTSLLTVTGQVKTITITPTQPPKSTTSAQSASSGGGFLSHPGKVAGLFVGLGILIFLVTAISILYCVRRYHRRPDSPVAESEPDDNTPQRRPSRMSQMGLIAGGRGPLGEKVLSPIQTGGWGGGSPSKSPDTTTSPLDKRRSFPLIVDQRLDPGTLWSPHHDNDSRISIRSLQDDQDYSRRMLRIANPDH